MVGRVQKGFDKGSGRVLQAFGGGVLTGSLDLASSC